MYVVISGLKVLKHLLKTQRIAPICCSGVICHCVDFYAPLSKNGYLLDKVPLCLANYFH